MLAWVDSDSLAVSSLQPLLAQADRLEEPGSERPGPRIGASYDGEWYDDVIYRRKIPTLGTPRDDINTGVFIIKPGVYSLILGSIKMTPSLGCGYCLYLQIGKNTFIF